MTDEFYFCGCSKAEGEGVCDMDKDGYCRKCGEEVSILYLDYVVKSYGVYNDSGGA